VKSIHLTAGSYIMMGFVNFDPISNEFQEKTKSIESRRQQAMDYSVYIHRRHETWKTSIKVTQGMKSFQVHNTAEDGAATKQRIA
jgi:hypothetical protein